MSWLPRGQTRTMLGVCFGVSLSTAAVAASKLAAVELPVVDEVVFPAGVPAIAVAFLISDLMTEWYGPSYTKRVVNGTIAALVLAFGLIWMAIALPAAPFYGDQTAFESVLGNGASIIVATVVTTLISQHVDVSVFHRIRESTGDARRWARNIGSTATSQLVDTVLFIALGFVVVPAILGTGGQSLSAAWALIVGQYAVKLLLALADTPLFYAATSAKNRLADTTDMDVNA